MEYPIKYSVLGVTKRGGWLDGYDDILLGHIISKCYVVESRIKYYKDDDNRIVHDVLFPYKDIEVYERTGNLPKRERPLLRASGQIAGLSIVNGVFDTYDEAKVLKFKLNEELLEKIVEDLWLDRSIKKEKIEEKKKKFWNDTDLCDRFETEIENALEDMVITKDVKILKLLNR